MSRPTRIISGGQTGADRGGLDAAIALGIPHGGWCPKWRRAEDVEIPACYLLTETASGAWLARTKRNVLESDGTVVFTYGRPEGGSAKTIKLATTACRPWLNINLRHSDPYLIAIWVEAQSIRTLNVAGSRESKAPGIQAAVKALLMEAFADA